MSHLKCFRVSSCIPEGESKQSSLSGGAARWDLLKEAEAGKSGVRGQPRLHIKKKKDLAVM